MRRIYNTDKQQALGRLSRESTQIDKDTAIVTSAGVEISAWTSKVKSNSSYNIYNVIGVVLGDPGSEPVEIGQQMTAVNLAEPFDQQGTLPANTYILVLRIGNKNVFYSPV